MNDICTTCGLPQDLCVCETIAKENQIIRISIIRKKFGKKYTVIQGIDNKEINIKDLTKKLKGQFACGGTGKGDHIELQGEHTQKVKETLVSMGFSPGTIEIGRMQHGKKPPR